MASADVNEWWMTVGGGRETSPAQGFAAGQAMYDSNIRRQAMLDERQQQMEMAKANLYLRTLSEINDSLKVKTAIAQREAQVSGFQELSEYLAKVSASNSWTDPEARAQFWAIGAKHPSIGSDVMRQLDSTTFDEAIKRKAQADRFANGDGDVPASVAEYRFRDSLRKAIEAEPDPEKKAQMQEDLQAYETKAGFNKGGKIQIETIVGADGTAHEIVRLPTGAFKFLPTVEPGKLSKLDAESYHTELRVIQEAWKNMDQRFLTNGIPDSEKYRQERESLYNKYLERTQRNKPAAQPAAGAASPTSLSVAPPAPRNPADRTANAVYQTDKHGPMRWTGTGWVKP